MPTANQNFSKASRLLLRAQFDLVFALKQKVADRKLVIFWRQNDLSHARLGLVISTAYGNSVVRNKLKRRLRELFRRSVALPAFDLVVLPSKQGEAKKSDMQAIELSWMTLLQKIAVHAPKSDSAARGGDRPPLAP